MGSNDNQPPQDWGNADEETASKFAIKTLDLTKENRLFYLFVVSSLGLATCGTVLGAIILAYQGKAIPSALVAIGSVAVGALGGLLSKTS